MSEECRGHHLGIPRKHQFEYSQEESWTELRDGIFRERREHARGRNLVDCGRICGSPRKSFGSIDKMWEKYSK